MVATTEIIIFETSDAFRRNPPVIIPALKMILKSGAAHAPAYYGLQVRSTQTGYCILNWASDEAHRAIQNAPSYSCLVKELSLSFGRNRLPETYHVQFSAPTVALQKPVTEVLVLALKAPGNRASVVRTLSGLSNASGGMLVFGQTREDKNKYVVLAGWESLEEHEEVVSAPEVAVAFEELYSLANIDHLYHTKLSQCRLP